MKTVGVLGGMGPQATMDFEQRFHRAAQTLIPQHASGGYPPLITLYVRHLPMIVDENNIPRQPVEPDPRLFEAARRLGTLADFLVVPSNFPHLFLERIEQASGRPVLNMIEIVLEDVRRRGWRRVGIVGFGVPAVYVSHFTPRDMECEIIEAPMRAELDRGIVAVMEGRECDANRAVALRAVETLRERKVDGVILGCSEIPLLLRDYTSLPDLVNPTQLLAEAAVRYAMAGR